MYRVMLISTRDTSHYLRFTLIAVRSGQLSSRGLRDAFGARGTATIVSTPLLARTHAAALYSRLNIVVIAALPLNAYTPSELMAMSDLPAQDYFVRTHFTDGVITEGYHFATVVLEPLRAGAIHERAVPARDVRMMCRNLRAAASDVVREVEMLWQADAALAEILRRRCGLPNVTSRGWIFDYSADFN